MLIVDADGHVAEGPSLAIEAMQRWPQHITPRADGRALVIEGRNYPEADGPGAGCPREYGLSTADGINYSSAEGVVGDADRDQIDTCGTFARMSTASEEVGSAKTIAPEWLSSSG